VEPLPTCRRPIDNKVEIARRCAFKAFKRDPILPKFADDECWNCAGQAKAGLCRASGGDPPSGPCGRVENAEFRAGALSRGWAFSGIISLIVADFHSNGPRKQKHPVGPGGAGSGAGSLWLMRLRCPIVVLALSLPVRAVFPEPNAVSIARLRHRVCMDRREEVIRYVQDRYGRDKVGPDHHFGALLSKAAVLDIGACGLQMPYGQVDRLSSCPCRRASKPVSIEHGLAQERSLRGGVTLEEVVKACWITASARSRGCSGNAFDPCRRLL